MGQVKYFKQVSEVSPLIHKMGMKIIYSAFLRVSIPHKGQWGLSSRKLSSRKGIFNRNRSQETVPKFNKHGNCEKYKLLKGEGIENAVHTQKNRSPAQILRRSSNRNSREMYRLLKETIHSHMKNTNKRAYRDF